MAFVRTVNFLYEDGDYILASCAFEYLDQTPDDQELTMSYGFRVLDILERGNMYDRCASDENYDTSTNNRDQDPMPYPGWPYLDR